MSSPIGLRIVDPAPQTDATISPTPCPSCVNDQFAQLVEYLRKVPQHVRDKPTFWMQVRDFAQWQLGTND